MIDKIDEMLIREGKWMFGRVWAICAILFMFVSYLWFSSWSVTAGVGVGATVFLLPSISAHHGHWGHVVDMSFPEGLTELVVLLILSAFGGILGTAI